MIYNVVNDSTECLAIEAREGGRDTNQSRRVRRFPIDGMSQAEILENVEIRLTDYMVCFVYQYKLIARGVKLLQAVTRSDALYRGDGYVGSPRGLAAAHLNVDMFLRVCEGAVAGGLFDELATVGEDERLRGVARGGNAVNEVGENDRLAGACSERDT